MHLAAARSALDDAAKGSTAWNQELIRKQRHHRPKGEVYARFAESDAGVALEVTSRRWRRVESLSRVTGAGPGIGVGRECRSGGVRSVGINRMVPVGSILKSVPRAVVVDPV